MAEGKQVTFSKGNLQYTRSTDTWSFAENQYNTIGAANMSADDLADKIDLFGWSGSIGSAKFGVSTSDDNNDYSGTFVDWGSNKIGNDATNNWRTLTYDEWDYLLESRTNASSLRGIAQVNGANGLILLPDNWTCPAGVTFKSGFSSESDVEAYGTHQTFTIDQWQKMETAGAVFLPTAVRIYSAVYNDNGGYWSATESDNDFAYYLTFSPNSVMMGIYDYTRFCGLSVRLVKDL